MSEEPKVKDGEALMPEGGFAFYLDAAPAQVAAPPKFRFLEMLFDALDEKAEDTELAMDIFSSAVWILKSQLYKTLSVHFVCQLCRVVDRFETNTDIVNTCVDIFTDISTAFEHRMSLLKAVPRLLGILRVHPYNMVLATKCVSILCSLCRASDSREGVVVVVALPQLLTTMNAFMENQNLVTKCVEVFWNLSFCQENRVLLMAAVPTLELVMVKYADRILTAEMCTSCFYELAANPKNAMVLMKSVPIVLDTLKRYNDRGHSAPTVSSCVGFFFRLSVCVQNLTGLAAVIPEVAKAMIDLANGGYILEECVGCLKNLSFQPENREALMKVLTNVVYVFSKPGLGDRVASACARFVNNVALVPENRAQIADVMLPYLDEGLGSYVHVFSFVVACVNTLILFAEDPALLWKLYAIVPRLKAALAVHSHDAKLAEAGLKFLGMLPASGPEAVSGHRPVLGHKRARKHVRLT